jgi:hypothetical protein
MGNEGSACILPHGRDMVRTMDYERRELIETLKEQADACRAELERKRLEREADPIAYDNWVRSEEPMPVQDAGLVFKDNDNALVIQPERELVFTDEQADAIGYAMVAERKRERQEIETKLAPLREKIANLEGKVEILLGLLQTRIADAKH